MMTTFSVKNFGRFQHYKDRSPPWIKFYNDTLDDYDLGKLPDASKAHLFAIWLLASRYDNVIPNDADWVAKRINANTPVDLQILADVGFIEFNQGRSKPLAKRKHGACLEGEGETEKKDANASSFDVFWSIYPKGREGSKAKAKEKFLSLIKRKVATAEEMIAGAQRYFDAGYTGSQYVKGVVAWLNAQGWHNIGIKPPSDAKATSSGVADPELAEILANRADMGVIE